MIPPEQIEPWDNPDNDDRRETAGSIVLLFALAVALGVGAWQVAQWALP